MSSLDEIAALVASSSSRAELLSKLPSYLSAYEWRQLASMLNSRTFQLDIIANLPLELTILVFRHLHPTSCFTYQQVSKAWRSLLSDTSLQQACLSQWVSPNDPPIAGESLVSPHKLATVRAQNQLAFRHSKPYSVRVHVEPTVGLGLISPLNIRPRALRQHDYSNYHFAWIEQNPERQDHHVRVYNLTTGCFSSYVGQGREKISAIVLTSQLVAWTTLSGICYARHVSYDTTKSTRLLSANVSALAGHDHYIAWLLGDANVIRTVCIWNTESGKTQSFQLPAQSIHEYTIGLIVGHDGQSVALINTLFFSIASSQIVKFMKYSLSGELEASGRIKFQYPDPLTIICSIAPMNNDDQYVCLFQNPYTRHFPGVWTRSSVHNTAVFDYKTNQFFPITTDSNGMERSCYIWKGVLGIAEEPRSIREHFHTIVESTSESLRDDNRPIRCYGDDRITLEVKVLPDGEEGDPRCRAVFVVKNYDQHFELPSQAGDLQGLEGMEQFVDEHCRRICGSA